MSHSRIEQLKKTFNLQAHPEGGYYSEQYRAAETVNSPFIGDKRACVSHIYFLLTDNDVSRWHKVLHDELWHMYEGDPLRILHFDPQHNAPLSVTEERIGDIGKEVRNDYFKLVPGGHFQAAQSTGTYSFLGCTVAPGFDFRDFSYLEDESIKSKLLSFGKDYERFF